MNGTGKKLKAAEKKKRTTTTEGERGDKREGGL